MNDETAVLIYKKFQILLNENEKVLKQFKYHETFIENLLLHSKIDINLDKKLEKTHFLITQKKLKYQKLRKSILNDVLDKKLELSCSIHRATHLISLIKLSSLEQIYIEDELKKKVK